MRGIVGVSVALASIACGAIASCGSSGTSTPSPVTTMDASVAGADATGPASGDGGPNALDGSPGGNSGDGGIPANVDVATACAGYALAFCTHFQTCNPRAFASNYFDSLGQCQTRLAQVCPSELSAPGTGRTASAIALCAQEVGAQSCAEWMVGDPPSCYAKGSLANDAGCEYSSQCQSTLCLRSVTTGSCGSCAARIGDGGTCDRQQMNCQFGLICADNCSGPAQNDQCGGSYGSTCVPPVLDGGACDKQHQCVGGLACLQGACAPAVAIGQPCVTWNDCAGDTSCITQSVGKAACEANTHAAVGAACSIGGTGQCTGSSLCSGPDGNPAAAGTCAPEATDGKTCTFNDECLYPATCDQGKCKAPDDATGCK
jgi:hypothetical protein